MSEMGDGDSDGEFFANESSPKPEKTQDVPIHDSARVKVTYDYKFDLSSDEEDDRRAPSKAKKDKSSENNTTAETIAKPPSFLQAVIFNSPIEDPAPVPAPQPVPPVIGPENRPPMGHPGMMGNQGMMPQMNMPMGGSMPNSMSMAGPMTNNMAMGGPMNHMPMGGPMPMAGPMPNSMPMGGMMNNTMRMPGPTPNQVGMPGPMGNNMVNRMGMPGPMGNMPNQMGMSGPMGPNMMGMPGPMGMSGPMGSPMPNAMGMPGAMGNNMPNQMGMPGAMGNNMSNQMGMPGAMGNNMPNQMGMPGAMGNNMPNQMGMPGAMGNNMPNQMGMSGPMGNNMPNQMGMGMPGPMGPNMMGIPGQMGANMPNNMGMGYNPMAMMNQMPMAMMGNMPNQGPNQMGMSGGHPMGMMPNPMRPPPRHGNPSRFGAPPGGAMRPARPRWDERPQAPVAANAIISKPPVLKSDPPKFSNPTHPVSVPRTSTPPTSVSAERKRPAANITPTIASPSSSEPCTSLRRDSSSSLEDRKEEDEEPETSAGFKNDGSFLEVFKKLKEEPKEPTDKVEPVKKATPKLLPSMVGKRRGGRVLKTGMVEKLKKPEPEESDKPKDPWSLYMAEVKKYREANCEEEGKTRALVNTMSVAVMAAKDPKLQNIEFSTAPFDPRFPNTNQTKHCYTSFLDYHRCQKARGADYEPCNYFKKVFNSMCPNAWVEKWNTQLEEGTFPGRI